MVRQEIWQSVTGMDIADLSPDVIGLLCGKHIRLLSNRNGPDLSYKPHLKHSTLLDCR